VSTFSKYAARTNLSVKSGGDPMRRIIFEHSAVSNILMKYLQPSAFSLQDRQNITRKLQSAWSSLFGWSSLLSGSLQIG
jgi:hypothetical protein